MRIASIIYFLTALAYAGRDIQLFLSEGPHLGSIVMVIFVAALVVLANGLFRGNPYARLGAIMGSLALALGFGYMALSLVLPPGALSFSERMEIVGPFFISAVAVAIAHTVALALLFGRPVNPNYSFKATVTGRGGNPAPRAAP